jgi:uncharacterized UPF0160 family protein
MMKRRSLGTHDGSFHADEVTACSLLLLFDQIDKELVYRTRDPKIHAECEFVCDVGGIYDPAQKRFDHHQAEYQGGLSSAGMVLLYLKEKGIIESHLYDYLNKSLIMGVDAHDNGVAKLEPGITSFSQVISNFMPIEYDVDEEEMTRAFFTAVDFCLGHLQRMKSRYFYIIDCKSAVKKAMKEGNYSLIFQEALPWLENFFDLGGEVHPAQFVIMPSGNHWKLRAIPPSLADRMKVRKPLPEKWAGLREAELKQISGIPGAIFCHKGRFISIWETKEDAIKALHIALEHEHHI